MVDSGAIMHMVSKKDLNKAELETWRISKNRTMVVTDNGDVQKKRRGNVDDPPLRTVALLHILTRERSVDQTSLTEIRWSTRIETEIIPRSSGPAVWNRRRQKYRQHRDSTRRSVASARGTRAGHRCERKSSRPRGHNNTLTVNLCQYRSVCIQGAKARAKTARRCLLLKRWPLKCQPFCETQAVDVPCRMLNAQAVLLHGHVACATDDAFTPVR